MYTSSARMLVAVRRKIILAYINAKQKSKQNNQRAQQARKTPKIYPQPKPRKKKYV